MFFKFWFQNLILNSIERLTCKLIEERVISMRIRLHFSNKEVKFQWRIQRGTQQACTPSKFWSTMFVFLQFCIRMHQNKAQIP